MSTPSPSPSRTAVRLAIISCLVALHSSMAELMGGHRDNRNNTAAITFSSNDDHHPSNITETDGDYRDYPDEETVKLVPYPLQRYRIINNGRPFYNEAMAEGSIAGLPLKVSEINDDYGEQFFGHPEEPYDRSDSNAAQPVSSIDKLTATLQTSHNLPSTQTSTKYMYPLISNSYANTKIQGNNKNIYYNHHKVYKSTTYKPPTYTSNYYKQPADKYNIATRYKVPTTVKPSTTTRRPIPTTVPTTTTTKASTTTTEKSFFNQFLFEVFNTHDLNDKYDYKSELDINDVTTLPTSSKLDEFDYDEIESNSDSSHISKVTTARITERIEPVLVTKPPSNNPDYHFSNSHSQVPKPAFSPTDGKMSEIHPQANEGLRLPNLNEKPLQSIPFFSKIPNSAPALKPTNSFPSPTSGTFEKMQKPQVKVSNTTPQLATKEQQHGEFSGSEEQEYVEYEDDLENGSSNFDYDADKRYHPYSVFENYNGSSANDRVGVEYNEYDSSMTDLKNIETKNITDRSVTESSTTPKKVFKSTSNGSTQVTSTKPPLDTRTDHRTQSIVKTMKPPALVYSELFTLHPEKTMMVTSMPIGPQRHESSIIAITHDLRNQLHKESIPLMTTTIPPSITKLPPPVIIANDRRRDPNIVYKPYSENLPQPMFTFNKSNISIAPDQETVSLIVGNQQTVAGGHFVGSSIKDVPYEDGSYIHRTPAAYGDHVLLTASVSPIATQSGGDMHMKPIFGSEASLNIGLPPARFETVPGKVVDETLDDITPIDTTTIISTKVKPSAVTSNILALNSKPIHHQLPTDLTPPLGDVPTPPRNGGYLRPPWDPRPGHFYNGHPEYARPPRPADHIKRVPESPLPNILPQFRPNAKVSHGHSAEKVGTIPNKFLRQPLMDRPPHNRPVGLYAQLQPPPLPSPILHRPHGDNLRRIYDQHSHPGEMHVSRLPPKEEIPVPKVQFITPKVPERHVPIVGKGGETHVATLQMIQSKQINDTNPKANITNYVVPVVNKPKIPLYVVYPASTSSMDFIKNETKPIVLDRADTNLFAQAQYPLNETILQYPEKNEGPLLKPAVVSPTNMPIRSDFPYRIEQPNVAATKPAIDVPLLNPYERPFAWTPDATADDSSILKTHVYHDPELISATLRTETETLIAIAYTPTEPSIPVYAVPINDNHVYVAGATALPIAAHTKKHDHVRKPVDKTDLDTDKAHVPTKTEFEAPFQASVNVDSSLSGWSIIKSRPESIDRKDSADGTTLDDRTPMNKDFDMESFKPQLFGGFKPIIKQSTSDEVDETSTGVREE